MNSSPEYLLTSLAKELDLKTLYMPERRIIVNNANVNRPGLPLTGFFNHFEPSRLQVIGMTEYNYLEQLPEDERENRISAFLSKQPKAVIYTTSLAPGEIVSRLARKFEVPLFSSELTASEFMAALIARLNYVLAPCITRHGVLVEVFGEGVLILGDSGIGKSETAIELVKRGHRLIADDAVELRRVSHQTIVGCAPEMIRHYVELRGIGIVDVKRIFGTGSVKDTEKVELIVNLEPWKQGATYDRMGIESEYTELMGIKIPSNTIPVHPGRNLSVIIEIAAINNRQKRMGYNAAKEFNTRLLNNIGITDPGIIDRENGGESQ